MQCLNWPMAIERCHDMHKCLAHGNHASYVFLPQFTNMTFQTSTRAAQSPTSYPQSAHEESQFNLQPSHSPGLPALRHKAQVQTPLDHPSRITSISSTRPATPTSPSKSSALSVFWTVPYAFWTASLASKPRPKKSGPRLLHMPFRG